MPDGPLISVVIPTCGRPQSLARCLDRLAPGAQALDSALYEVIISDDAPDGSGVEWTRMNCAWARAVRGPGRGPAANRNWGAAHARGAWLAFIDDDCVPESGWLAAFASRIGSGFVVFEGRTTCRAGLKSPMWDAPVNPSGGCLWSCNLMISRELFQTLGGFDERMNRPAMEDVELQWRVRLLGREPLFVPDAVVDHPPRRRYWGVRYARLMESHVYFWRKQGRGALATMRLLAGSIKARIVRCLSGPFGSDTLIALASVVVEAAWIATHAPLWVIRHRRSAGKGTVDAAA